MALPPTCWHSSLAAIAITLAPLPAAPTIGSTAVPPAAPEADLTPRELMHAAEKAIAAADWPTAESHLASLVETYRSIPEMADPVRRAHPLRAVVRLRQKKFDAETLERITEALADAAIDPAIADELAFWRGLCLMQSGAHPEAQAALSEYVAGAHAGVAALANAARPLRLRRCAEAVLLQAVCLLQANQAAASAALIARHLPEFRRQRLIDPAGRAAVFRLHALITAGDHAGALACVHDTQPHLHEITQLVAWHLLVLQLGAHQLDAGHPYDAIVCLQRVWPQARIIAHQQAVQARLTARMESVLRSPDHQAEVHQIEGALERIQRELASFTAQKSFDAALRFRVAAAYRDLGRAREAALVLDDMLARLPPDPVVAQASLCLVQCWMQIDCWPRAVAAADAHLEKFGKPDNPDVPVVRFLKATALHAARQPHDAELAFATVHQLHQGHDLAARALFMEGICLLEQDLNLEAIDAFAEIPERFPKSEVVEDSDHWSAMALSFHKQHEAARDRWSAYLDKYKADGRHTVEARFRLAFSTFGMADYAGAAKQLKAFASANPDHPLTAEAHLLLGDALGSLGRLDDALASYRAVDRVLNARFHEEAIFRMGNVYKISEQPDALRAHFGQFIVDHPSSPRLAEAVYWIGQSHRHGGRPEAARDAYWQIIQTHGDKLDAVGIEDILLALPKLYSGDATPEDLVTELTAMADKARSNQPMLALRCQWAKAHVIARSRPDQARAELADLLPLIEPRHHHPRLIADCADAMRELGRATDARALYRELRKWHPRAIEKDRVFLGLGLLALEQHRPDEALECFARFERETIGSPRLGEVASLKAEIFENKNRLAEAQNEYERVLELPTVSRQLKARTLLRIGDVLARQNQHLKSTAYFERVYVSYGKFLPEVAAAYAKRAEALEHLDHRDAAVEVWQELAGRSELAEFPEAARARARLRSLGMDDRPGTPISAPVVGGEPAGHGAGSADSPPATPITPPS